MIVMATEVDVKGSSGKRIYDFMLNCTDEAYDAWWPGTHLAFHTIQRKPGNLGNVVYFDEYVGKRRLTFTMIVTEAVPNKKVVWQMMKIIKLPGWLTLEFEDHDGGVKIVHAVSVGFAGIGRLLDPILRIYFSDKFERELKAHAQTEFHKLSALLY